jgi:glycosyltransferase involved in cell wall biosynthesis
VTPFFDPGPVFGETIASVLGQSLQAFEWIVVDDASRDAASLALLDELAADPRVRIVRHAENRGRSAARNSGFRAAACELVFVLDQDDLLAPTALEKCAAALHARPEWSFVNGWCQGFGAQSYRWERGFEAGVDFLRENGASGRALVRRAAFDDAGGYDESLRDGFEDWDFWLRCAERGRWGGTLPEVLDWFRRKSPPAEWESPERVEAMRATLAARHPRLAERFPAMAAQPDPPFAPVDLEPAFANPLAKRAPRALLVLPWFALGGADRFNLDLARALVARGFELTIATTLADDRSWEAEFEAVTPDCFVLPRLVPLREQPRLLRHLIESRRPDVVFVSNSELGYLLLPALRAHCPEPVYVDFCHMEQEEWKSGGYPRLSLHARDALDATAVSSRHLAGWMEARGADPARLAVVHTGIDAAAWRRDPDARKRLRDAWSVGEFEPLLVYAARIAEQKQPDVLAHTLELLAARGVPFRAAIAGDGPLRDALAARLVHAGLAARVHLLGAVAPDGMRELLSACDVFFLPSNAEGIALSLFEAMAMELAVVAADVGGQAELVVPGTGVLLPPSVPAAEAFAYAAALEPLLRDPALRNNFGRRARARVEREFAHDRAVDDLLAVFEKARTARRPAAPIPAPDLATLAIEFLRMQHQAGALAGALAARDASLHASGTRLARIDGSRVFRWLRRIKRSAPYRTWARARYGPDWEREAP